MKESIIVALLTTIIVLLDEKKSLFVNAEQEENPATYSNGTGDGELGSNDEIFLFFIFLFFALCVSLFGSFLFYVSYLDDRIMKLYVDEGNLVEGEVVATEFTRGVDAGDAEDSIGKNFNNSQKEYFVSIEYSILLSENYPIRIRKQLRVLKGDFFHPGKNPAGGYCDPLSLNCASSGGNVIEPTKKPIIEIIASRDSFFKSFQFDHGKKLQLLVLPDHHLSALPARQVERRLSTRYRLFSISFVLAAILIAVFCFRLAAPLLQQQVYGEEGSEYVPSIIEQSPIYSLLINFVFAMIALAPIPCIHHLLHELIQQSLEGEYFEMGGEVIKGGQDDSSLSSRSDFGYNHMDLETQSTLGGVYK